MLYLYHGIGLLEVGWLAVTRWILVSGIHTSWTSYDFYSLLSWISIHVPTG